MASVRKICCTVEEIIDHGSQVYSILMHPQKRLPRFRPGHFLHLTIDEYDPSSFWPESRVFSIASSPDSRDLLRITYSVKGNYTARMEKELAVGCEVWVKLPYGDFVIDEADAVIVAGGTGMTAFSAFLDGLDIEQAGDVVVVYGVRSADLLVYRDTVFDALRRGVCKRLYLYIEDGGADEVEMPEGTVLREGMVDMEAILKELPDASKKQFYIAGPPVMMDSVKHALLNHAVEDGKIHIDAWE